jgi:hypothetical protein
MTRRALALIGVFVIAGVLTFLLRDVINELLVLPLAYLWWALKLFYLSLPQVLWWVILLLLVTFILLSSLLPEIKPGKGKPIASDPARGQVENLALSIRKSKKGTYFKWLVANRLGKLAYQILLQRENGKPRSVFAPLEGTGWKPAKELQNYLEVGLRGSFADYPNSRVPFMPPAKTPLDYDITEVVDFLESQVTENSGDNR